MSLIMKKASVLAARAVSKNTMPLRRGYHDIIIDHYENPRNVGSLDKNKTNVGTGNSFSYVLLISRLIHLLFIYVMFWLLK